MAYFIDLPFTRATEDLDVWKKTIKGQSVIVS